MDLTKASFADGSYQFGAAGPLWELPKPCSFYNTSQCLRPDCKFSHFPDHRSLRLVLNGPNICRNHLLGEHGCKFAKTGRRCWYSHDLTKAALPLHDKKTLAEHLILAEAWFRMTFTYQELLQRLEAEKARLSGAITEQEFTNKMRLLLQERTASLDQWLSGRKNAANKAIEEFKETGTVESLDDDTKTAVIDVSGLSGADILRSCGVENPFGRQEERKLFEKSHSMATNVCDVSDGWETEEECSEQAKRKDLKRKRKNLKQKSKGKKSKGYSGDKFYGYDKLGSMLDTMDPFSESNMFELGCQSIKPWEDDAMGALMMLNGGF